MKYRLKDKYKGKKVAVADPAGVLLTDAFVMNPANEKIIKAHADSLSRYIEHRDGSPIGVYQEPKQVAQEETEDSGKSEDKASLSADITANDAISRISEIESVAELDAFIEGEKRKSVLKASDKRRGELEA